MIEHSLQIDFADDRGLQEQLRGKRWSAPFWPAVFTGRSTALPAATSPNSWGSPVIPWRWCMKVCVMMVIWWPSTQVIRLITLSSTGMRRSPVIVHRDAAINAPEWGDLFNVCPSDYLTITKARPMDEIRLPVHLWAAGCGIVPDGAVARRHRARSWGYARSSLVARSGRPRLADAYRAVTHTGITETRHHGQQR